jgi:hypothetical protein
MTYANMSASITRPTADRYHALLFVGVCNRERYVLSLNRWTNLLNQMYGYPLANIRILVGTYSGWASMVTGTDVTYNATRAQLDTALADYAAGGAHALGANDNLFIFTYNHGGNDADSLGSYLCCENFTTKYYASDLATRIGAIHCRQIVLFAAQCESGGFVDPFIDALWTGTRGAVIAASRADEDTQEAVSDKLFASAFNGRMVQNPLDDNIDLGITGEGSTMYTIPGYHTNRVDWGPTGVISTREAFNWVYDHYVNHIHSNPTYAWITEEPLYRQKDWMEADQPLHIRLGEPDLVLQDCAADTGEEPSTCANPWQSPDVYPDNTDQFPTTGPNEYVPAHENRFFVRTANRGTAPSDDVWRVLEVRGLGFTGGPVGPPRIDRAIETVATETASARLRPGRAHSQYQRILIGGDFGHGCISAAAFSGVDQMSHGLWNIVPDNDQAQCNLDPASVSGSVPVDSSDTNSNAGTIIRTIPVFTPEGGTFELRIGEPDKKLPVKILAKQTKLALRKGQRGEFRLEIQVAPKTPDGLEGRHSVAIIRNKKIVGGVTFQIKVATASARIFVHDNRGQDVPKATVELRHPGDPRILTAVTDGKGIASFGPLNPGFYFAGIKGERAAPVRIHIVAGKDNSIKIEKEGR